MFNLFPHRKRVPSETIIGAMPHFLAELGDPSLDLAQVLNPRSGIYYFHEGDLFAPGAGNFVFEPVFETPLFDLFGKAFPRRANTFSPIPPAPGYLMVSQPNVEQAGLGGLEAGYLELQGLINPSDATNGLYGGGL